MVDVDSSLNPSPTVARRADQLREELDNLLQEAQVLRRKLQDVHPAGRDGPFQHGRRL